MGEYTQYQPLTKTDRITVALYRTGIVISTLVIALSAYILYDIDNFRMHPSAGLMFDILLTALYIGVGLSVFFIHLYVSRFHRALRKMYYLSLVCLAGLYYLGGGDVLAVVAHRPYGPLLLIPLAGCLGFVTAKEAFCFRIMEGYIIAMAMPVLLLVYSTGMMSVKTVSYAMILLGGLLLSFTFRKVFMPVHCDIGDKSAYQ